MSGRLRHVAHFVVAAALYYSGTLALRRWLRHGVLRQRELTVIGLHRVLTAEERVASSSEEAMVVLLPTFVRLLESLKKSFEVVNFDEVMRGSFPLGGKPKCLLTFDDAWQDTFANATPALRRSGLHAVVFVPTGLLGSAEPFWVERLTCVWNQSEAARQAVRAAAGESAADDGTPLAAAIAALKQLPNAKREEVVRALTMQYSAHDPESVDRFMSWEELAMAAPVLRAESHTVHHVLLDTEDEATARQELVESRGELCRRTGREVRALAYPNGNHNEPVRQWAKLSGYEWAFTVCRGIFREGGDQMQVPRLLLQEGNITNPWGGFSPAMLHLRLTGWR